jgi:hypothetical protein
MAGETATFVSFSSVASFGLKGADSPEERVHFMARMEQCWA